MKSVRIIILWLIVCFACCLAEATSYQLIDEHLLDIGNWWEYQIHITEDPDAGPVDWWGTQVEEIVGNETIEGYDTAFVEVTSDVSGYGVSWSTHNYSLTQEYLLEIRYEDEDIIQLVRNNNPFERAPVWVDESDNNRHFGHGEHTGTLKDPYYTWDGYQDSYITFLRTESVTVPAGTFDCVVVFVRSEFHELEGLWGYVEITVWDNPNVEIVKTDEYVWIWDPVEQRASTGRGTTELSSFSLVNHDPQLSGALVSPTSGDTDTDFYWYVDYYDEDGDSPVTKYVYIDGAAYPMNLYSGSASNGTYQYGPKNLGEGFHNYYFYFTDGHSGSERLPSSGTSSGPSVTAATLTVSGRVIDKYTLEPFDNIRVGCWHEGLEIWTETGADGFYELTNLPPGEVHIRAIPELCSAYASIGAEIELTANISGLDFELPPAARLSGKVIDTETAEPLVDIEVTYWNDRYAVWQNDFTDANGIFTLCNLPPGAAEIKARPDANTEYAWNLPWGSCFIYLDEGQSKSGRIIALQKGAPVTGYIRYDDGSPASGIEYEYGGRMSDGWGQTDIDGGYTIRLPLGTYTIAVDEDDFGALHQKVTITDINQVVDISATAVGHWKMNDDELNSAVEDSSGKGNHGTAQQYTSDLSIPGKINGALTFNGSSDYIDCGNDSSLDITGSITLSAWVRPDLLNGMIISKRTYDGGPIAQYLLDFDNNDLRLLWYNGGWKGLSYDASGLAGQWSHVVCTYDADSNVVALYVNGSPVASDTEPSGLVSNTVSVKIGAWLSGDVKNAFSGAIDNVMIFNKALSGAEVEALYNEGFGTEIIPAVESPIIIPDMIVYTEQTGGQISGTVSNPGANPKTGEFIILAFEAGSVVDPNTWYTVWPIREANVEQAGPFSVAALPPGNYDMYLCVENESEDEIDSLAVRDSALNVPVGTTGINLNYDSEGSTAIGRAINTDGRALLGACVLLTDSVTGDFTGFGDVDPNGEYIICNVPGGIYAATAVHSKYINASTFVQVSDLANPLAGHWKMNDDELNTTVEDSSGKGNHGTAQQYTSYLSIPGKINGALTFNDSSDYIDCGNDSSLAITGSITLSAWVRPDLLNGTIISKRTYDGGPAVQYLLDFDNNDLRFLWYNGGWKGLSYDASGLANQWSYVAGTYDADSNVVTLYVNGSAVASDTETLGFVSNTVSTIIGAWVSGGVKNAFSGAIDNVMIFNRAVTVAEIVYLYSGGGGTETFPTAFDVDTIVTPVTGQKEGADLNGNGIVHMLDFAKYGSYYGATACDVQNNWCQGTDFNQDGNVDIIDLSRVSENWLWKAIWIND